MSEPIAVIGIACRFPGAADYRAYWRNLCAGRESIVRFGERELRAAGVPEAMLRHPRFVPAGGHLPDALAFDADFFGYSPSEAATIDPQQRVFLEVAVHALQDAGIDPQRFAGRIAVYAGASANTYAAAGGHAGVSALQRELGGEKDHLATRVAYKLGLTGPAVSVQTACSTSLVAVHHACMSLLAGDADAALAGGVSLRFPFDVGYVHEPESIASADGRCRPFDAAADGTVRGSGAGVVVLRRLRDALDAADPIHAVLLATAVNNDGAEKVGYSAPSVRGQETVIATAHEHAGVTAGEIGYVEAHGTGTQLGDPIEVAALARAFARDEGAAVCRLGSVKGNIGHLDVAAGIAGLIKALLVVAHGRIPPTLHFTTPNAALQLEATPFSIQHELSEWTGAGPRTAGVSSFGMGGTNAHAIVREAVAQPAPEADPPGATALVLASAPSADGAEQMLERLAEHCETTRPRAADVAWTTQTGRTAHRARIAVLARAASLGEDLRDPARRAAREALADPRVALLLPGQGNRRSGLLAGLYRGWPSLREDVDRCCAILAGRQGEETRVALTEADGADASWWEDTANAQPALFVAEYALALLLRRVGVEPVGAAGHSLGELVAAVLAGAFSEQGGLGFAAARGRLMSATPAGAMATIMLDPEALLELLPPTLDVAGVDGAQRVSISGPRAEVAAFCATLEARGVPFRPLPIGYGFHSRLMDGVLDAIEQAAAAAGPSMPLQPFVSTVTGTWIGEEAADPAYWARQARSPVRFAAALATLGTHANVFVEAGPGSVLTRLAQRELDAAEAVCVSTLDQDTCDGDALLRAIGALWCAGTAIDWHAPAMPARARRIHLPGHPFARVEHAATPATPVATATASVLYEPLWRVLPPLPERPHAPVELTLFGTADPLRDALVTALRERGHDVGVVEDLGALDRSGGPRDWTVCLMPGTDAEARHVDAFGDLLALAGGVAARRAGGRLDVIARNAHSLETSDALAPAAALARGVALVLPQEVPEISCRLIDVAGGGALDPGALVRELLADGPPEVSLRGDRRWMRRFVALEATEQPSPLVEGGSYVVLGADGRIGATLVAHLREHWGARVAAVGRRASQPDDSPAVVRIVRELGRTGAVAEALRLAQAELGRIDAVFHCAGVTRGPSLREIRSLDRASVAEQWPAKVMATRELAAAAAELDVPLCVAFSSLASVLGGLELSAYAAANAYQDALATSATRARPGSWQTIGWDAWSFADETAVPGFGEAVRRAALTPEAGMRALEEALTWADSHPHVLIGHDVPARARAWLGARERSRASAQQRAAGRANGRSPDVVLDAVASVLGYETIDADQTFADLGGDSLLAVQLIGELHERIGVEVPLRAIFESVDLAAFCEHVQSLTPQAETA